MNKLNPFTLVMLGLFIFLLGFGLNVAITGNVRASLIGSVVGVVCYLIINLVMD